MRYLPLLLLLLMVVGCDAMPGYSSDSRMLEPQVGPGLVVSDRPLLADVPMPIGFVYVQSRSRVYYTTRGARVVDHVYEGRSTLDDGAGFYRQNMPHLGWKKLDESRDADSIQLDFIKKGERAQVHVTQTWSVTTIVVIIRQNDLTPSAPDAPTAAR